MPNISFQIYYLVQIRVNTNMVTGEDQTPCTQTMDILAHHKIHIPHAYTTRHSHLRHQTQCTLVH
jgi:hypothetical protein